MGMSLSLGLEIVSGRVGAPTGTAASPVDDFITEDSTSYFITEDSVSYLQQEAA